MVVGVVGCWLSVVVAGSRVSGVGGRVLGCRVLVVGCWLSVVVAGSWVSGVGCRVLVVGCCLSGVGCCCRCRSSLIVSAVDAQLCLVYVL
jgi:hypothetical protein